LCAHGSSHPPGRRQCESHWRGKRRKRQPCGLSGEAGSDLSLLARNEYRRRSKASVRRLSERTGVRHSACSIVTIPHCGTCSFSHDLSGDETPATGSRRRFAPMLHKQSGHPSRVPGFVYAGTECPHSWLIRAGATVTIYNIRNTQKTSTWKRRIIECRSSGKSIKEWCKEHGLDFEDWLKPGPERAKFLIGKVFLLFS